MGRGVEDLDRTAQIEQVHPRQDQDHDPSRPRRVSRVTFTHPATVERERPRASGPDGTAGGRIRHISPTAAPAPGRVTSTAPAELDWGGSRFGSTGTSTRARTA
ncbi:hypothetical protein GCM10017673_28960 [Streptosporangium violaceochromogenes]|nr:hypothetical protein GCM10017673_28960 [Streptosporangium violaceochromogenes]